MHCASSHPTILSTKPILPVTLILEIPPSREQGTETGPSSATMTIALRGLPSNTVKADNRKVKRTFMELDGRRADVVVTDAQDIYFVYLGYRNKQVVITLLCDGPPIVPGSETSCTTAVSPTSMMPIPRSIHQSLSIILASLTIRRTVTRDHLHRVLGLPEFNNRFERLAVAAHKRRKVHRERMASAQLDMHLKSLRWRSVHRGGEGVGRVDELRRS